MSAHLPMRTRLLLINLLLLNALIVNSVIIFTPKYLGVVPSDLLGIVVLLMMLSIALYAFSGYGVYKKAKRSILLALISTAMLLHIPSISYMLVLSPSIPLSIAVLASIVNCCSIIGVLMLKTAIITS